MTITLSVEGWIVLLTGVVSAIGGAAWWMSSLYSKVCEIREDQQQHALTKAKDDEIVWRHINGHTEQLQKHERDILLLQSRRTSH